MTYNEFIQNIIDTRGQWTPVIVDGIELHHENHHIIPRCLNGKPIKWRNDTKHENLIWLTYEEHYEAHRLLAEEYSDNKKICQAYWRMNTSNNDHTKENYARSRELFVDTLKGVQRPENVCKAIGLAHEGPKPDWYKKKISDTMIVNKACAGENNGMYGKHHTDIAKQLLSYKAINRGKHVICVETGEEYLSANDAARRTGSAGNATFIRACCKGIKETFKGMHWKFKE